MGGIRHGDFRPRIRVFTGLSWRAFLIATLGGHMPPSSTKTINPLLCFSYSDYYSANQIFQDKYTKRYFV